MEDIDFLYMQAWAANQVKEGWQLNPNEKVQKGIFKGLFRIGGQCPCSNPYVGTPDGMCPCKGYREEDKCCCNLFIKKNV
jgi:ferredoxin-thioredoxin reductase catalytic subunit